ncbi:chlorhexidine efflux transporter, partial [Salmonella enterica subsp. enterica serovar Corvallis]
MQHDAIQRRSLPERIFHAVCFEGIATAILAPTTAWLMQRSVLEMGNDSNLLIVFYVQIMPDDFV